MIECPECGSEVKNDPHGRKKIFCSDKCRNKNKNRRRIEKCKIKKKCEHCGIEYFAQNKKQKFCTVPCHAKNKYSHEGNFNKSCPTCKIDFNAHDTRKIYCSTECKNNAYEHICEQCGTNFKSYFKDSKYCSRQCSGTKAKHESICECCGGGFIGKNNRANKFCSRNCFLKQINARVDEISSKKTSRLSDAHHIIRAKKHGVRWQYIDLIEIYKRDNFVCQICNEDINMNLSHPHPLSASIDHIIPLSRGGTHVEGNVNGVHLRCNIQKSDK